MAIDSLCKTCGKQLRVADEHAGKEARCPNCQTVYTVPQKNVGMALTLAPPGELPDSWQMKTPEGLVYGPVTRQELDHWCRQGRITPRCQILREGESDWRWSSELYPELVQPATMQPATVVPVTAYAPMPIMPGAVYYPKTHRGVLIVVLSLLGFASFCFVVSVVALVLGLQDLSDMKAGRMDPEGRPLTIVGLVLAILWIVANLGYIGFVVLVWAGLLR